MSGTAFLRRHGWKLGSDLWWHDRLPMAGHSFGTAVLQQAMWFEQERLEPKQTEERSEGDGERSETRMV